MEQLVNIKRFLSIQNMDIWQLLGVDVNNRC